MQRNTPSVSLIKKVVQLFLASGLVVGAQTWLCREGPAWQPPAALLSLTDCASREVCHSSHKMPLCCDCCPVGMLLSLPATSRHSERLPAIAGP